jgi:hypothetical protein
MKTNENSVDRLIRIGVGVALLSQVSTGAIGAWAWLGAIPLLTGVVGFCPLYALLGMSTCKLQSSKTHS